MFIPKWCIALVVIVHLLRHLLNPDAWERAIYEEYSWVKQLQWFIAIVATVWLIHWAV